jgi:hypothetical protein
MNLRYDANGGDVPIWSATQQYYLNDVVVSPTDSAAYMFSGSVNDPGNQYFVLGGDDPAIASLDPDTSGWRSFQGNGLRYVSTGAAAIALAAPGAAFTIPAACQLAAGAGGVSTWNVILNYTATGSAAWVATDSFSFTATPNGGTAVSVTVWPGTANPNNPLSGSAVLVVTGVAATTSITLSGGVLAGSIASVTLGNLSVSYQRVA